MDIYKTAGMRWGNLFKAQAKKKTLGKVLF